MTIHVLADQVIAQIAAGEVIERPASVIKELIENALDAGATNIHVSADSGGRNMIRISDNGHGIKAAEVELAFTRHATSKLNTADDLMHIRTLGFRGEALASIASVSRVTLVSRAEGEEVGHRLRLEGGKVLQHQSVGAPVGTVITVENLFYNTPARLKFLKAENTEKRHITALITRYAMAYPHVRFILEQDKRETFRANGTGQLSDVLLRSFGAETFKDLLEVDNADNNADEAPEIQVYGFTSAPSLNRADRSRITLFVNGRWVQDSSVTYAVIQAYHTFLMKGRYPVAVLMIDLPPEQVDVNVHPTKAEVRFQDPNAVFSAVQRAVRRAVIGQTEAPSMYDRSPRQESTWEDEARPAPRNTQLDLGMELESTGWYPNQVPEQSHYTPTRDAAGPTYLPPNPNPPERPRTLPMLRVIGQVGASYIVTEGPAGMYLIDQHAAHERILYEEFMLDYAQQKPTAQLTLSAQTIELPPTESQLIEEHQIALQSAGFKLESFGPNTFIIRSVPLLLSDHDPVELVREVLEELEEGKTPGHASIEEKIIQRVCKRAAVKAGTILSMDEMRGLIQQLERCQSPHTCPHGRPTMVHMSSDKLAREFGRK